MKLKNLFNTIIEIGISNDLRPRKQVEKGLAKIKKSFEDLSDKDKKYFDQEKLTNPYSDSRIYNSKGDEDIKTVMVGVDLEVAELLLIDRLNEKGKKIDAAITHHPEGTALVNLYDVMSLQSDVMHQLGVPINIAEGLMSGRMKDVAQGLLPINYSRSVDAAKLLEIPFLGAHTPADNCVTKYLQKKINAKKPDTLGDIVELLLKEEEYKISYKDGNGPKIIVGSKNKSAGKVFVDMTGGTSGPKEAIEKLADSGVGTIIGMHMSKDHAKVAEKNHVNVIIAGHMASDVIGLNLLLDQVEKKLGKLKVVGCSGFTRVKRK